MIQEGLAIARAGVRNWHHSSGARFIGRKRQEFQNQGSFKPDFRIRPERPDRECMEV